MYLQEWPISVDVFITTYGEDLETIRRTVSAAVAMQGKHDTWVLDDGRSDEVRDLAAELGARYVRRLSSNGAKAGNINHALSIAKGDFFVIFDADFVPLPQFLHETVPFFATDDVAFVQTPQVYGNLDTVISKGAGYMQSVFYKFIQPGRNRFNAAFSVGTNVIYRRSAADSIGGIYSDSKSEDVWTSLMLHEKGWRTVYIPTELAVGDTPETVEAYTKQQLRWATGGFEIMLTHNPLSPEAQPHDGPADPVPGDLHALPDGHRAPAADPRAAAADLLQPDPDEPHDHAADVAAVLRRASTCMQILVAFYTLGSFRWQVLLLAAVSFPIYTRALINAIFKKDQKWHVTGQKGAYRSPFAFMMPQVLFFQFLLITTVVGVWKDLGNGYPSLALAWNATNTLILGELRPHRLEGRPPRPSRHQGADAPRVDPPRDRPRHRTSRRCRMTWTSRIRLLAGMLVVLVLAALATYQLNETRGVAVSDSAQILAKTYGVGHALLGPGRRPARRRR